MSTSSSLALQRALFAMLSVELPGIGIFDHVPADAAYPYVTFGPVTMRDIGGVEAPLDEHTALIFVWSKADSRVEAAETAAAVRTALEEAAVSLVGHTIVSRAVEQIEITRDAKTRVYRAQLRLRATTEPLS